MRRMLKLRTKLFLISAGTIFIPLLIFSLFGVKSAADSVADSFCREQVSVIKKTGTLVDGMFNKLEQTSLLVITNSQLRAFLTEEPTIDRRWDAYSIMAYLKSSSNAIRSLHLIGSGDRILTLGDNTIGITKQEEEISRTYNGRVFWSTRAGTSNIPDIYMCRLIRNVTNPVQHLGYIKIYLDLDILFDGLYSENNSADNYYILNADGTLLYATDPDAVSTLPELTVLKQNQATCLLDRENTRSITPYFLSVSGMMLIGVSDTSPIDQQIRATTLLYLEIGLCCFLFCLLVSAFLSTRTLEPLARLTEHMQQLECEDFSTRIDLSGNDEFAKLGAQFNKMAAKIQSLIEEVYAVSLRRKEAELRALQTQIKPHFLYNTLDLAYWTAQSENATMTADMITALSQFFRFGLIGSSDCTTVENEVEHLRFYVTLQRQQNPNFDFDLSVEPEVLTCPVVKLVLQPLVENAIIHGIAGIQSSVIQVNILREEDTLVYFIEDNGAGVDEAEIERLLSGKAEGHCRIGLRNVNDRIKLMFGEGFGLTIHNRPEGGTRIRVTQPFTAEGSAP